MVHLVFFLKGGGAPVSIPMPEEVAKDTINRFVALNTEGTVAGECWRFMPYAAILSREVAALYYSDEPSPGVRMAKAVEEMAADHHRGEEWREPE